MKRQKCQVQKCDDSLAGLERGFSRKAAITWRLESHGALWSSVNNPLGDNTFHSEPTSTDDTHAHAGHLFFKGNDSGGIDISEAISLASQFLHHRQRCGRKRVARESHVSIWRPPAKSNKFKKPGRLVSF
jgi:hypothetical protein